MRDHETLHWALGRLVRWGLDPQARPADDPEYQDLVERCHDAPEFRAALRALAAGLGLKILDISAFGLVLAPAAGDGPFALKPSSFRTPSTYADDRLLDGLVQVAIAASVFPRARDLDEDADLARPPVTVDEIERDLRALAERLEAEARGRPDPEAGDDARGLYEAWRVYAARAAGGAGAHRRRRPTRRIIENGLDRLREQGCFTAVRVRNRPAWQPTRRYHLLVRDLAATRLYAEVQRVLSHPPVH